VLIEPDAAYQPSYLAALDEEPDLRKPWTAEGLDLAIRHDFAEFVRRLRADSRDPSPRPDGFVPCTTLWWVVDGDFLGRVSIRHRLVGDLVTLGGHIGYWIRPSARGRGHGAAAFLASLPHAYALALDPVLLTCDHDNEASRRIIEGAGGVFEGTYGPKRRYWVPTSPESGRLRQRHAG
jgi:predicted acetyltransferase